MTPDEAMKLVEWLGQMIPSITDAQSGAIKTILERADANAAFAALKRYTENNGRIDVAQIATALQPARRGPDPLIIQSRCDQAAYESEREKMDGFFARVDDVDLCRARAAVLAEVEPYVQIQLAGADPRTSPTLRSLIYQYMTGGRSLRRSAS